MPNQYVNKVTLADGTTIIDLTSDTVTAADVFVGVTFHTGAGATGTGTLANGDLLSYGSAPLANTAVVGAAAICEEAEA